MSKYKIFVEGVQVNTIICADENIDVVIKFFGDNASYEKIP